MREINKYLFRLLPAANLTAIVAAMMHVLGIGIASVGVELEILFIALLT